MKLKLFPQGVRGALALAAGLSVCVPAMSVAAAGPPPPPARAAAQAVLPDLTPNGARIKSTMVISNRTFSAGSCSVVEGCISTTGSRRLLTFDLQIMNLGNGDAVLGTPAQRPDLYVFSACHGHYHILDSLDYALAYGGLDTGGTYDSITGTFFLTNKNVSGVADTTFSFGGGGSMVPVTGDWDGDGTETVGVYNPITGAFFLRNSNTPGNADVVFTFGPGNAGLTPIVGDWDGNGTDTIGLYNPITGAFFLKNSNANGPADATFTFGIGGANLSPVTGDWDGNDFDTVGLYDSTTGNFFLRNSNANGPADQTFSFGSGGTRKPITGDWNGDGFDTVGLYDPTTTDYFLRNTNAPGNADTTFQFGGGGPNVVPVTGDWDYDQSGQTVPGITGLKQAFCWLDSQRVQGSAPAHYNCSNQGITAGWSDVYGRTLDCQWIDITGLPAGNYQMRASVNDTHTIVTESNYANN